jgi:hypothetical protein
LKKLFYTQDEIDEFIRIADADGNGEVRTSSAVSSQYSL